MARSFFVYTVLSGLGEIAIASWLTIIEPAIRIPLMVLGLLYVGPVGIPLAASFVVGTMSFGVFPIYMTRRIGLKGKAGIALQMKGGSALVVALALGVALLLFAPSATRWPTFIAKTAAVSIGIVAVALAANRSIRELVTDHLSRLRARF
jgi:hypothetical protein